MSDHKTAGLPSPSGGGTEGEGVHIIGRSLLMRRPSPLPLSRWERGFQQD